MPDAFFQFFERAMLNGGRSTALKPLGWALGILILGVIGAGRAGLEARIVNGLAIFAGLTALLYLVAYVYFMFKDRDALRSERFAIEKLNIEKRFGDSSRGIVKDIDELPSVKIEPNPQLEDSDGADK